MKPYEKYFEPFDKMVICFSISRSKPRGWYSISKKTGHKETRFFSIERVDFQETKQKAYRFVVGPFMLMAGI